MPTERRTCGKPEGRELTWEELSEKLSMLCGVSALEVLPGSGGDVLIPFLMNDSAEAYLLLEDCRIPGGLPGPGQANGDGAAYADAFERIEGTDREGLLFRAGGEILTTVYFRRCLYYETLYRYHRILHNWTPGDEQLRMLVNMAAIVEDKRRYLGPQASVPGEERLGLLMHCAPFRHFTPWGPGTDGLYDDTAEGRACLQAFASEAGEKGLALLIRLSGLVGGLLDAAVIRRMRRSVRLFDALYGCACSASNTWEERHYGADAEEQMQEIRQAVHRDLEARGYTGIYPEYRRGSERVLAVEEHPFVAGSFDDTAFAVRLLVCRPADRRHPFFLAESAGELDGRDAS